MRPFHLASFCWPAGGVGAAVQLFVASSLLASTVHGFHTGAGQCLVGEASVGPPHLPSTSGDTTLSGNGIEVSVDGTVIVPGTPFTVAAGTEHNFTISATAVTTPFKGYLFALSDPSNTADLSTALSPADTTTGQIAPVCFAPVVGVTHVNNDTKTSVNATFVLDADTTLALDVTVVIQNKLPFGGVSQFGYAGYQIVNSASTTGGTTSAPVATSTGAPVSLQTTSAPAPAPTAPVASSPSAPTAPSAPSTPSAGEPTSEGEEYYPTAVPTPANPAPTAGGSSPTSPTAPTGSGNTSGAGAVAATAGPKAAFAAGAVAAIWSWAL